MINVEELLEQVKEAPLQDALRTAAEHRSTFGIIADSNEDPPAKYQIVHGGTTEQEGWDTLREQLPEIVREIARGEIAALMTAKQNEAVATFSSALDPLQKECDARLAYLASYREQPKGRWARFLDIILDNSVVRTINILYVQNMIERVQNSLSFLQDTFRSTLHRSIVLQRGEEDAAQEEEIRLFYQHIPELRRQLGEANYCAKKWLNIDIELRDTPQGKRKDKQRETVIEN